MKNLSLLALLFLIGFSAQASGQAGRTAPRRSDGADELTLLHARPFVLEEPYMHTWRREAPPVRAGFVLVLQGKLELIERRQTSEPVLFVGAQTAERVNAPPTGAGEIGQLIVLVPAPLDAGGRVALDPWQTPVFFGSPQLAEEVDEQVIQQELVRARALGAGPPRRPKSTAAARALVRPVPLLRLRDRNELELELANLIETYSPAEVDLVRGLRVPVHRR